MEAQNKSRVFGLKLNLPLHVVDSIQLTIAEPCDRLLQVLIEFMKQTNPRPTWRVIADALRSPAVNLPHLAMKVEADHFPDPPSTREAASTAPTGMTSVHFSLCTIFCAYPPTATQSEAVSDVSASETTSPVQTTTTSPPPPSEHFQIVYACSHHLNYFCFHSASPSSAPITTPPLQPQLATGELICTYIGQSHCMMYLHGSCRRCGAHL